jgi:hypothetical protein
MAQRKKRRLKKKVQWLKKEIVTKKGEKAILLN